MNNRLGKPSEADVRALEFYILETHRRLKSVDATRTEVSKTYSRFIVSTEFDRELNRILVDLEKRCGCNGRLP